MYIESDYKELEELDKEIELWVNKIEANKDNENLYLQSALNTLTFLMGRRMVIKNRIDRLP